MPIQNHPGLDDVVAVDNTARRPATFLHSTAGSTSLNAGVTSSAGSGSAQTFQVDGVTQCQYGVQFGAFFGFTNPLTSSNIFFGMGDLTNFILISGTGASSSITVSAGTGGIALSSTGTVTSPSMQVNDLTSGRVTFAGTSGRLVDDADMTFATDTLTVTNLVVPTAATGGTANFHFPSTFGFFYEDFSGNSTTSGEYSWSNQASGAGAAVSSIAGEVNHPGIRRFSTGTTATGFCGLNNGLRFIAPNGGDNIRMIVRLSANTGIILRCGIQDVFTGADVADGYYFEFDPATSANWRFCTANTGSRTKTSSSTAVAASTWYRLEIVVNSANSSVEFFVDGVSLGTITTNIPTSSDTTGFSLIIQNDGVSTTSVNCDLDLVYWWNKNLTR